MAERCPVCGGSGEIRVPPKELKVCHGCNGKGWVVVPD